MSTANDQLIERFYGAFGQRDGDAMAAFYASGATFSDPVFPGLKDGEPGAMWRMLTGRATDLEIELVEHEATDTFGTARWLAHYTFGQTGRHVDNDVRATFKFENGKIIDHRDDFSFYAWSRQALGVAGLVLGWTPLLRSKVQGQARKGLDEFIAEHGVAAPAAEPA